MDKGLEGRISKGKLLVAMPKLEDPNFRQTVILLCEHGPDGALGVVLNRPTELAVSMLIDGFRGITGGERVYSGGPVAKNGMLVLCRSEALSQGHHIFEGVFVPKDLDEIQSPGALGENGEVRCYLGYAGWAAGQLEEELLAGDWGILPSDPSLIFDADPSVLWAQMMRRLGKCWAFYASMPPDPGMN